MMCVTMYRLNLKTSPDAQDTYVDAIGVGGGVNDVTTFIDQYGKVIDQNVWSFVHMATSNIVFFQFTQ